MASSKLSTKIILGIFLVALIGGIIGVRYALRGPDPETASDEQNPANSTTTAKVVSVSEKTIKRTDGNVEYDIAYPHIEGVSPSINATLAAFVNQEMITLAREAAENEQARRDTQPAGEAFVPGHYGLWIEHEQGEISSSTVSVVLLIMKDSGGAHPNKFFRTFNFNAQDGTLITLKDVFKHNTSYLRTISTFAVKDLSRQLADRYGQDLEDYDTSLIEDGAGPAEVNFQAFTITKDQITFYFPPYQIAAYAAGDFRVKMPRP